jgi:PKD repeat protein
MPGQAVSFAATASASNCSGSPTYAWSFGDGGTSTDQNPTHTYASGGSYNWSVTVAVDGRTCTQGGTITVSNPVAPPVITLMKKVTPPFKIVVTGSNLQNGIRVFIDGVEWTSVVWKNVGKIQLTGGTSLKAAVPKGSQKTFLFLNPDGGQTSVTWGW